MNFEDAIDDETLVDFSTAINEIQKHNISNWDEISQILKSSRVPYLVDDSHLGLAPAAYSTRKILIELGY